MYACQVFKLFFTFNKFILFVNYILCSHYFFPLLSFVKVVKGQGCTQIKVSRMRHVRKTHVFGEYVTHVFKAKQAAHGNHASDPYHTWHTHVSPYVDQKRTRNVCRNYVRETHGDKISWKTCVMCRVLVLFFCFWLGPFKDMKFDEI